MRRIELGIRASLAWLAANRRLITLFQFAATEERFAPTLRRGQEVAIADVVPHVKEGIVAGRIRDADPFILTHAILGVINHLARAFVVERGEPPDDVADAAVAFCLGGLTGDQPLTSLGVRTPGFPRRFYARDAIRRAWGGPS